MPYVTAELSDSEQRWVTTLSSIGDAVIATDITGRITFMNAMAERLTGWTNFKARVDKVFNIINEKTRKTVESSVTRVIRDGMVVGLANHTILVRKDGTEVPIDNSGAPIKNEQGTITGVVLVFRDISERRRVEQMKDNFLGLVSHELRTPLTIIGGSLEVALHDQVSREDAREMIQNAADSTEILHNILENMLELTRYQTDRIQLKTEPLDILYLANTVIEKLKGYGAKQRFHLEIPNDLPIVKADRLRIERILHNLLDNAVKYSPEESEIRVVVQNDRDYLVTSIIDQGEGILKENLGKLFQLFSRLDKTTSTPGTGLGLVVCKHLVEAHDGWIKADSTPGQGTTFSFGLPLYPKD